MSLWHFLFDTVAGCLALLYLRDYLLFRVEQWRVRKLAELERAYQSEESR